MGNAVLPAVAPKEREVTSLATGAIHLVSVRCQDEAGNLLEADAGIDHCDHFASFIVVCVK